MDESQEDGILVCDRTTRRVMNRDPDTSSKTVSSEAVTILSKATELFMIRFVSEVAKNSEKRNSNRIEIHYDDIARFVLKDADCEFLTELLPPSARAKRDSSKIANSSTHPHTPHANHSNNNNSNGRNVSNSISSSTTTSTNEQKNKKKLKIR